METTTETTVKSKIEDQLQGILKIDFGCHKKFDGLDPDTPTFIRVNVKESLNADQTQGLLDFKELHAKMQLQAKIQRILKSYRLKWSYRLKYKGF